MWKPHADVEGLGWSWDQRPWRRTQGPSILGKFHTHDTCAHVCMQSEQVNGRWQKCGSGAWLEEEVTGLRVLGDHILPWPLHARAHFCFLSDIMWAALPPPCLPHWLKPWVVYRGLQSQEWERQLKILLIRCRKIGLGSKSRIKCSGAWEWMLTP